MILDFNIDADRSKGLVYLKKLMDDKSAAEIKKIQKNRTSQQNRYLHALFQLFAGEFGWTLPEVKAVIKRELGYTYQKGGQWFLRHTSDMDVSELSEFIDKFRNFSARLGYYLPSSDEFGDNYIEIMKQLDYIDATQKHYG